jgi:beta-galactosidase
MSSAPATCGAARNCSPTHFMVSPQVGFRQTEVRGGQLLHNNVPIMVRGVNRHEFDDRSGKALTEGHMLRDVLLMKRSNFNAVRCSHYPNHSRW